MFTHMWNSSYIHNVDYFGVELFFWLTLFGFVFTSYVSTISKSTSIMTFTTFASTIIALTIIESSVVPQPLSSWPQLLQPRPLQTRPTLTFLVFVPRQFLGWFSLPSDLNLLWVAISIIASSFMTSTTPIMVKPEWEMRHKSKSKKYVLTTKKTPSIPLIPSPMPPEIQGN